MEKWKLFAECSGKKYIFLVAIIGNILYLFTGISLAWPSPILAKLQENKNNPLGRQITPEENDLIGSVFSIGGAIGPVLLIYALEAHGRKFTMAILAALFPIFYFVLAFSESIYLYYVSRIAQGIAVGGSFSVLPIYISEIVPTKNRGAYMSFGSCFIQIGCLFSYSVGPYISILYFNLIIALLSLLYVPFFVLACPETLYYTMQKQGEEKTLELLQVLRNNKEEYQELKEIKSSIRNDERGSLLDIFKTKSGIRAFCISTGLLLLQQFCGINIIITYSQTIFEKADVSIDPVVCSIIVCTFQTVTGFITPLASTKLNIKTLLCISFAGVGISNTLLGLYFIIDSLNKFQWIPLLSLVCFMVCSNCGLASLPWVVLGELYPLKVKTIGASVSTMIYWCSQFLVTYFYNKIDEGTSFLIFAVVCLSAIAFVQFFLIETKGKSLQEIHENLKA